MNPTQAVRSAALHVTAELASADGVTLLDLEDAADASDSTVRRAIKWLLHLGAPVVYATHGWVLEDKTWRMPERGMALVDVDAQRAWKSLVLGVWTCERDGFSWRLTWPLLKWELEAWPAGRITLAKTIAADKWPVPLPRNLKLGYGRWLTAFHLSDARAMFEAGEVS